MGRDSHISAKLKLISAVLLLHLCYASSHIVSRAALNLGVSKMVLLVYRNIIATVLVAPFAYFLEKNDRPKLTFSILVQLFLLALCGITLNQASYLLGMYYLSPTYVSAIQNSMPGITFAMAAVLSCFFGLIQLLCIAAYVETDIERWKIHSEGELFTILYIGLVATGIAFCLQTWCIDRAGPLFVAVFQPLQTVLVAVMAFIAFGDLLYSGGLIGFILIIVGLYIVLWGKNGEKKVASVERGDLTNQLLEHESIEKDMII